MAHRLSRYSIMAFGLLVTSAAPALTHSGSQIGEDGYAGSESAAERIQREFNNNLGAARELWRRAHPPERGEGPGILADQCERRERHIRTMDRLIFEGEAILPAQTLDSMRQLVALERTEERSQPCPPVGPAEDFSRTAVIRDNSERVQRRERDRRAAAEERASRMRAGARADNRQGTMINGYDLGPFPLGGVCPMDDFPLTVGRAYPRPSTPAPPSPAQPAPAPQTTPAQGVTQQEVDALAQQQRHFDDLARERREAGERRAAARNCSSIQIGGGLGQSQIPRTNYGFVRDGAAGTPERPAAFSPRQVPTLTVEANAWFRGIGRFTLGYREGDARNRVDIAPSTTGGVQGVVGTAPSPSGSTGVSGNLGLSVASEVSFREFYAGYRYIFGDEDDRATLSEGRVAFNGFAGVTVNYRDRDHLGVVSIVRTTAPPISVVQTLDQHIRELELGVVLGGQAIIPLADNVRLAFDAEILAYIYDYDQRSRERREQNIGPTVDQAYTLPIGDSESGFDYGGNLGFELDWAIRFDGKINPMLMFLRGEANFRSSRAQMINPRSGDDVLNDITTYIGRDEVIDWRGLVGVWIPLGGSQR